MIDIYVPSYHRPNNFTLRYLQKIGYDMKKVTVFVDDGSDDVGAYKMACEMAKCNLVVFSLDKSRERYDYVHRSNILRRTAGQARNQFFDYAKEHGVDFFCVMDDDTTGFERKGVGRKASRGNADANDIFSQMLETEQLMRRKKIGCFGWSQSGDFIGGENAYILRPKVMNMTFYLLPYVYRGERGVLDTDTSAFVGMMNEGFFVGSYGGGCVLHQRPSAHDKGGLTDVYRDSKLLRKSLVCVIQFPSAIKAERQKKNGGRLHHKINYRYLRPMLMKSVNGHDNIAWDTYEEDYPFTNEPKNKEWRRRESSLMANDVPKDHK